MLSYGPQTSEIIYSTLLILTHLGQISQCLLVIRELPQSFDYGAEDCLVVTLVNPTPYANGIYALNNHIGSPQRDKSQLYAGCLPGFLSLRPNACPGKA
jgi:hypothetical protein